MSAAEDTLPQKVVLVHIALVVPLNRALMKGHPLVLNPDYIRLAEEQWYSGLRKAGFPEN